MLKSGLSYDCTKFRISAAIDTSGLAESIIENWDVEATGSVTMYATFEIYLHGDDSMDDVLDTVS